MKKVLKKVILFMCLVSMILPSTFRPTQVHASNVRVFDYEAQQHISDLTLSWKAQKGISYYRIYRVKTTKYYASGKIPKQKEYKRIAKVSKGKTEYVDKKVKRGEMYSYIIKGYKKTKGRDKLVCTTFKKGVMPFSAAGVVTPNVENLGYGEEYDNTINKLYIYINYDCGMQPTGYIVYRKKEGEKSYKKIKLKKLNGNEFVDETVEPGNVYRYKAKSYIKVGDKKYYSKKSSALTLSATNSSGGYQVKLLNNETDISTMTFRVTSKEYNADLIIKSGSAMYTYQESKESEKIECYIRVKKYSFDNKNWIEIPKKGITLKAKDTIYLQGDLYKGKYESDEPITINYDISSPYISYVILGDSESSIVTYKGSRSGYTEAEFDFVKGSGYAYQEWD